MLADPHQMSATPFARLRLWLRHSARRAAATAPMRVWLLAAGTGCLTAYAVLLFNILVEAITTLAFGAGSEMLAAGARGLPAWRAFLAPLAGGIIVALILSVGRRLGAMTEARCKGVAEVIEARAAGTANRLSWRGGIANFLATTSSLGFGASAGREGPLVHAAGSIAASLGRRFGLNARDTRTLLGASAAAAVAAAFNAPIAGVLFALEVVLSNYALSVFGPVTLASVLAALIVRGHADAMHMLVIPDYADPGGISIPLGALLGIVCGLVAWTFLQAGDAARKFARTLTERRGMPAPLLPVLAGAGMGLVAIFLPEVLGDGYQATRAALSGQYTLPLLMVLLGAKMVATVFCLACRFGAGVFSTGIYLGAMAGAAFAVSLSLIPGVALSPTFFAMIGMGAVGGAIIGAPISTTLIMFEITGDYSMTAALMLAVGIATLMAQVLFGASWFHYQLRQRGYDLSEGPQGLILRTTRAGDIMKPAEGAQAPLPETAPRILPETTLGEALALMTAESVDALPVVDPDHRAQVIGTITHIRALRHFNKALVESHIELHR